MLCDETIEIFGREKSLWQWGRSSDELRNHQNLVGRKDGFPKQNKTSESYHK